MPKSFKLKTSIPPYGASQKKLLAVQACQLALKKKKSFKPFNHMKQATNKMLPFLSKSHKIVQFGTLSAASSPFNHFLAAESFGIYNT
jgi:hypothetical protein